MSTQHSSLSTVLAATGDNRTGAMPVLGELPDNILVYIFAFLEANDLKKIRRLGRFYNSVFKTSSLLRYHFYLSASRLQDQPSALCSRAKLDLISAHNETCIFGQFNLALGASVSVDHNPSTIYELSDGMYVLGDCVGATSSAPRPTRKLRYLDITKRAHEGSENSSSWAELDLGCELVDIGLALQEHDLIAAVTQTRYDPIDEVRIRLVQFSTGKPHPAAARSSLLLVRSMRWWGRISVTIEIVGPYLVILLTWPWSVSKADCLCLFNWMTGTLIAREHARRKTWSSFVFLSPDYIAIPNLDRCTLEVLYLPSQRKVATHTRYRRFPRVAVLNLPSTHPFSRLTHISCRANLFGSASYYGDPHVPASNRGPASGISGTGAGLPFRVAPKHAIIVFNLFILDPSNRSHRFSFVAHRSSILRAATRHIGTDDFRVLPFEYFPKAEDVPWHEWGPACTRWGEEGDNVSTYITTTAGQRQVLLSGGRIVLRDYSPYVVEQALKLPPSSPAAGLRRARVVTEKSRIPSRAIFATDIESVLPYVEAVSAQRYDYQDVLMNEETIMGLYTDDDHSTVTRVDIFSLLPNPNMT